MIDVVWLVIALALLGCSDLHVIERADGAAPASEWQDVTPQGIDLGPAGPNPVLSMGKTLEEEAVGFGYAINLVG